MCARQVESREMATGEEVGEIGGGKLNGALVNFHWISPTIEANTINDRGMVIGDVATRPRLPAAC